MLNVMIHKGKKIYMIVFCGNVCCSGMFNFFRLKIDVLLPKRDSGKSASEQVCTQFRCSSLTQCDVSLQECTEAGNLFHEISCQKIFW